MTKKIFRGILISSVITLLLSLVFIIGVQYGIYRESGYSALQSKAYLISPSAEANDLQKYSSAKERITLINEKGEVLYDNKAVAAEMENHLSREEIKEALSTGTGYSVRHSETLGVNSCYYAIKLESGNILRVADETLSVGAVVVELLPPIAAIALLAFVLALVLASAISKRILKPINEIDLDGPLEDTAYEELTPFISKISAQRRKIGHQIEELKNRRSEFEIIAENMSEGLLLTDTKGHILTHNSGIRRFFGVTDDINGQNILTINRSEVFREVFENIKESRHYESTVTLGGRCYQVTANPVFDGNNTPCGAVILVVDVTEKEKREKLRREFTANVSHELKTPLTSILGISDMLKNGIVAPDDIKDFGADINKEAGRLLNLVNDIIKLSELDEGAVGETETVDLLKTANEVASSLTKTAEKQGVTLRVEGESTEITAGESLVFEMIYNLCDNAVKYNKENGLVTVTVGNNGAPFVSVKDTGIGIAPEHTERIFERFYRVDKGRSRLGGGTGLGLSIVKHIAASFGGKITLQSTLGEGTEITVTFKASQASREGDRVSGGGIQIVFL